MEYGDVIFDNSPQYSKDKLEKINTEAARIITEQQNLLALTICTLKLDLSVLKLVELNTN